MQLPLFVLVALCICILTPANALASPSSIQLCYEDREQPPYYFGDNIVPPHQRGIYVDILTKVTGNLGIELQLIRRPWKRCIRLLELNKVDGVLGASFVEGRQKKGRYPTKDNALDLNARLAMKSYSFYVLKDHPIPWNGELSALQGHSVGVPLGYAISSTLIKAGVKVSEQPHTKLLLEMLHLQRIEAIATLAATGDFLIGAMPEKYRDIVKLSPALETKAYYLLISHDFYTANRVTTEKIWELISVYRTDVSTKYGIVDRLNQLPVSR